GGRARGGAVQVDSGRLSDLGAGLRHALAEAAHRPQPAARGRGPFREAAVSDNLPPCPRPPAWGVDWAALDEAYEWVRALRGCGQPPEHHGEGDVWTHTRMVCQALAAPPACR